MGTNLRAGEAERKFVSENKPEATFERNEHSEWERICAQAKPSDPRCVRDLCGVVTLVWRFISYLY
jgi:hypothetical protein